MTQRDGAAGEEQVFLLREDSCWSVGCRVQTTRASCALMRNKDTSEEICNIQYLKSYIDVGLVIYEQKDIFYSDSLDFCMTLSSRIKCFC